MPSTTSPTRRAPRESRKPGIFWLLAAIALPPMNLSVKFTFHNAEKLPSEGALVLSPNHYSEIDPLVIGVAVFKQGRLPRFLAKASLFSVPGIGALLRWSGQIPVERAGGNGHQALRSAEELVEKGRLVVVYPEGSLTRDPDLWPMRGKTGAVRIALEQDIPVIPVAHWGTQALMPRYGKKLVLFRRKPIHVSFGDPVDLDDFRGRPLEPAVLAEATNRVMDAVTALLADLRGEPVPAERWDPATHKQTETGRFDG
ncbi:MULTISPECIES: lysophospholipid acyltransferase family protein [unclassified Leifsonia]|uniref:lysophospholipid acyltransferase family protein n=1 Tax=unclassified Leifsonia TaxID=2663824 RepID=UPI0006F2DCB3|nr:MULTISPECIES: lysophospholipid acyltransferase family protein [unclassified Leifsonia]KQX07258.1 acyl-phosphate glycerol 3-phosphate acyltransferase [Leifsonia sp. Root1293]KRA11541.1 acyl-phosphate glycerol 3-phosphate acyltransferase [Leifsonia sp. Root60]